MQKTFDEIQQSFMVETFSEGIFQPIKGVYEKGFPGGSDGKASACNVGDPGSSPGSRRSPGEKMATHSSTLAWKISWMEEPGGL